MKMKKLFALLYILLSLTAYTQTKSLLPNKTLRDSVFHPGDLIQIPALVYALSHPILPQTKDSLVPVANFLRKHPTLKVEIDVHTDSRGSIEHNLLLSEFRAKHVWEVLVVQMGIDSARVTYQGLGESYPIITKATESKAKTDKEKAAIYAINQRTELRVTEAP